MNSDERDFELQRERPPELKVWRSESMLFILAVCARLRIQTVPDRVMVAGDGAFQVTLLCDRALADEVRAEFNGRPIQLRPQRTRR